MPEPSLENREPEQQNELEIEALLDKIAKAAGSAVLKEEFEQRQKKIDEAAKKMVSGQKLIKPEIDFLSQESFPNEVEFSSFELMAEVFLRIGLGQELIDEIIEHERAHFDAAKEKGLDAKIIIKFYKLKNGSIQFLPAIKTGFEEGGDSTSENIRKVVSAPSTPSPSDKSKIE